MKRVHVLIDGGELVYDTKDDTVEVGDRGIPETVLYRHSGDAKRPACEVKLEVWDGVPVVAEVKLAANREDGVSIRAKDIKLGPAIDLDGLIAGWLTEVAFQPVYQDGVRRGWRKAYPGSADDRRTAARMIERARRQTRRRLSTGQLRKVAETYRAARPPKHEAIAVAFDVSPRTAQRYIEKAREAGLLP